MVEGLRFIQVLAHVFHKVVLAAVILYDVMREDIVAKVQVLQVLDGVFELNGEFLQLLWQ